MLHISKNRIITMTRGDTVELNLSLQIGNELDEIYFDLQEGDIVKFRIMYPNCKFEDALIKKEVGYESYDKDTHSVKINLDNEDTRNIKEGCYYYEIKLYYSRGNENYIETLHTRNKFYIIA